MKLRLWPAMLTTLILAGCGGGGSGGSDAACTSGAGSCSPAPTALAVSATTDKQVNRDSHITLIGSAQPSSGATLLTHQWTQIEGTPVALSGADTRAVSFTSPHVTASEKLVFSLAVTDSKGQQASDSVVVTVLPQSPRLPTFSRDDAAVADIAMGQNTPFATGIAVANLGSTGAPDVVFGGPQYRDNGFVNQTFPITVLLNDGTGRFIDGTSEIVPAGAPAQVHAREFRVADFNGDSRADVFMAGHGFDESPFPGEPNFLMLSTTDHLVDASSKLDTNPSGFTHAATTGDVDGDGDIDLVASDICCGNNVHSISVYINDGAGQFVTQSQQRLPLELSRSWRQSRSVFTAVELADLDGDSFPDLIVGGAEQSSFSAVYWNDGTGKFTASPRTNIPQIANAGIVTDIEVADLNGDGLDDLLLSRTLDSPFYSGRRFQFMINDGRRGFDDYTERLMQDFDTSERWIIQLYSVDLDMDGDLDLVSRYEFAPPGTPTIYLNTGAGSFVPTDTASLEPLGNITPLDADGDGDADLLSMSAVVDGQGNWTLVNILLRNARF